MAKEFIGELELNRIYQRDCLEGMRMLPDKSVDLIVIDPPYNIGKDKRWDKYGRDEYLAFMSYIFGECERVLKDKGSFYWFHNDFEQIVALQNKISEITEFKFNSLITVDKLDNNYIKDLYGSQNHFRNYLNLAEYCLFYTKKLSMKSFDTGWERLKSQVVFKGFTDVLQEDIRRANLTVEDIYELAFSEGRYKTIDSAKVNIRYKLGLSSGHRFDLIDEKMYTHLATKINWTYSYSDIKKMYEDIRINSEEMRQEYEKERYTFNASDGVKNVWSYSFREDKKTKHPTQKPIKLIEDIINYSSNKGDTVLDCFMGSGTTAVASVRTKRKFIGFEREPEYIEIANKRLDNEVQR